jgi:hypothetical protein
VTYQEQAPEWDRDAVVRAYVAGTRDCGPGRVGPRAVAGILIVVLALAVAVLVGYVSRPASHSHPAPSSSPAALRSAAPSTPSPGSASTAPGSASTAPAGHS